MRPSVVSLLRSLFSELLARALGSVTCGVCAACPIWASSVGRRDLVAAEPRSGRGKRVVEGVGGARGANDGVSRCFFGRFVPPAGAFRGGTCVCLMPDLDVLRRSSGPDDGEASLWPRQARRGGGGRSSCSRRRGL